MASQIFYTSATAQHQIDGEFDVIGMVCLSPAQGLLQQSLFNAEVNRNYNRFNQILIKFPSEIKVISLDSIMPKVEFGLLRIEILLLLCFGGTVLGTKKQEEDYVLRGAHLRAYAFNVST